MSEGGAVQTSLTLPLLGELSFLLEDRGERMNDQSPTTDSQNHVGRRESQPSSGPAHHRTDHRQKLGEEKVGDIISHESPRLSAM